MTHSTLRSMALALVIAIAMPLANAQRHNRNHDGNNHGQRSEQMHRQPDRPRHDNKHQPAMGAGQRPGVGQPAHNRPNVAPPSHNRPAQRPDHRPQVNKPGGMQPGPIPFRRPTPPPGWRPARPLPAFNAILGITLGTALNVSVNYLVNGGYNVAGYGNNMVYLNNVPQLGFYWPNATLYYGNRGLIGSEFVYSTPVYDMSRYDGAYASLMASYGIPYTELLPGGGMQATWYGPGQGFISLRFNSQMGFGGQMRYFTTLSFGG